MTKRVFFVGAHRAGARRVVRKGMSSKKIFSKTFAKTLDRFSQKVYNISVR